MTTVNAQITPAMRRRRSHVLDVPYGDVPENGEALTTMIVQRITFLRQDLRRSNEERDAHESHAESAEACPAHIIGHHMVEGIGGARADMLSRAIRDALRPNDGEADL